VPWAAPPMSSLLLLQKQDMGGPPMAPRRVSTESFNLARLRSGIKPFRLHYFSRLRSTNDHSAILRKRGDLYAPAIVLTGHQVAGRGRGTNTWWSSQGCLTATFVFPIDEHLSPHQLPLIAGLGVRNAVAELTSHDEIQLKWPNDLLHRKRKLAGLLCERVHKADLIGLGLNVNVDPHKAPKALRNQITSLSTITGRPLDMTDVLVTIAKHLYPLIARRREHPFASILREYDKHHALRGRQVGVAVNGEEPSLITGRCEGLDSVGRLLIRRGHTLHRVVAGQVQMR